MNKEYIIRFFLLMNMLVLLSLVSLKFYFRLDTTKEKIYTLSSFTKEILNEADGPIQVTWFKSINADVFFPSLKYLSEMLLEYEIFSNGKFLFTKKNINTLSLDTAHKIGIIPRQIETYDYNNNHIYNVYSGLLIEYNGKNKVIPFIDDIGSLEYDIARLLLEMQYDTEKVISIIAPENFTTTNYPYVVPWIEYAGYKCNILSCPIEYIPTDIPLLVIGSDYIDAISAAAIDSFLCKNGNAVFFVSGNTIDIKGSWTATAKTKDNLIDMLSSHGIFIKRNLVLDLLNFRLTMSAFNQSNGNSNPTLINYPFWVQLHYNFIERNNNIFAGFQPLQMFWPSSLEFDLNKNSSLKAIATTSKKAYIMNEPYNTDPFGKQIDLLNGNNTEHINIIAQYTKPSKVIVIPDEYIISNAIDYTGSSYNMDFMINCIEHISDNDSLLELKNKRHTSLPLKKFDNENKINNIIFRARIITFVLLPTIIIIIWLYTAFIIRKHK